LKLYWFYSDQIAAEYNLNSNVLLQYGFRKMRAVRRDIIHMFSTFIKNADPNSNENTKFLQGVGQLLSKYK